MGCIHFKADDEVPLHKAAVHPVGAGVPITGTVVENSKCGELFRCKDIVVTRRWNSDGHPLFDLTHYSRCAKFHNYTAIVEAFLLEVNVSPWSSIQSVCDQLE